MKKPKIISVANQKGGVGKTTTALNVGVGFAKAGKKVLLIDLDPQSNLSGYLGYENDGKPTISDIMSSRVNNTKCDVSECIRQSREGVEYIPSHITLSAADYFLINAMCREQVLKSILRDEYFSRYDYIIIDCLPSLGILLTNALAASSSLLIPVQAQKFAFDGLQMLLNIFEMVRSNINPELKIEGILITMMDNTNMAKAVEEALKKNYGDKLFKTKIKRSVEATNSSYEQKSLINLKNSRLGEQYSELAKELLEGII